MIAKEFLMQVRSRYEEVQEQKEYVDRIRDSLGVAGINYDSESCQGSSDPHSREHLLGTTSRKSTSQTEISLLIQLLFT